MKNVVEFPEKDESQGELLMTFTGPSPTNFLDRKVSNWPAGFGIANLHTFKALDILSTYLTSSPVAPLNREYIEIESPLWYTYICFVINPAQHFIALISTSAKIPVLPWWTYRYILGLYL